jgi:anti-sigma-K factor RskA
MRPPAGRALRALHVLRRHQEPHTLAGAYAMDAVTDADRARFERHLGRCANCAAELRELREAAARLAAAVAVRPPDRVVRRAVEAAATTRQLPPDPGRVMPRLRAANRRGGRRRGPAPRLAPALASLLIAGVVTAGGIAITAEQGLTAAALREHQIAEVLNAPDAVMATSQVRSGGTATIVLSMRDRALVFTAAGLPPLPGGHCYQLWLIGPAGERSAGMLPPQHDGMTGPVIATGLRSGEMIGLTMEPGGGSAHPTSAPILMLGLPA